MALQDLPVLSSPPQSSTQMAAMQVPFIPQSYTHPGVSLQQVLAISKAFWKQSLIIAAVIFVIVSVLGILKPKTYIATATLLVNYEINDPLGGKEFPLALIGNWISTQMELIGSPVVLMPVVDRLKLDENKKYIAGVKGGPEALRTAAEALVEKNLGVDQGRYGSQLIFIKYTGNSPDEAAEVANTVADIYANREYQHKSTAADDRSQAYQTQLAELKDKVSHAQNQLTDFYKRTGLIAGDGQADIETQTLAGLEARLLTAQNARRDAEITASAGAAATGSQFSNSLTIQNLRNQLSTLNAKMAEIRQTDGPKHPRVLELQSQIDATQKTLSDETKNYSRNTDSDLDSARRLEAKLRSAIEEQRTKVIAQRQLTEQREKYRLDLESAQTVYRRALESYDQISRASSSNYNNVSVISRATPPTKPSSKRTRVSLILGAVAGMFLGISLPLAYGFVIRRIRCRDDIERDFGIPVIAEFGAIPV